MPRAKHGAVGQHDGRGRARAISLSDGDRDYGGFDEEFHVARARGLPGGKDGLPDGLVVEKCAVLVGLPSRSRTASAVSVMSQ